MDPRTDSLVKPFVEAARGYIRRALSLELDGSAESLAFVDHYARTTRDAGPGGKLESDVLRLAAAALGAYFGEVLITAHGGGWVIAPGQENTPEAWSLELDPPSLSLHPVALAAAALAGDEVPGYDDRISPPLRDVAALQQLLDTSAPVDAELFYSLTGRFEAIERMRELWARSTAAGKKAPAPSGPIPTR